MREGYQQFFDYRSCMYKSSCWVFWVSLYSWRAEQLKSYIVAGIYKYIKYRVYKEISKNWVPMSYNLWSPFCFVSVFLALRFSETIVYYVQGWNLISTLEFIVKSTLQKKKATIFRSQELYSKRVAKYLIRKLSSATKCAITWKYKSYERKYPMHMYTYHFWRFAVKLLEK